MLYHVILRYNTLYIHTYTHIALQCWTGTSAVSAHQFISRCLLYAPVGGWSCAVARSSDDDPMPIPEAMLQILATVPKVLAQDQCSWSGKRGL